jgi:threonine aldolase
MEFVDLRSDTVTKPTPEMWEAMATAEVGDDVYGEDPTVNRLQEIAAEKMGKEAGLFVASGTMGNLVAILAHCQRGDEVIVGKKSHVYLHEAGGISALGAVHSCQITNQADGSLALDEILSAIRSDDPHEPVTRLICLENTHNACGGVYQTKDYTNLLVKFAHDHGLFVHLDGARIFNAAIAQGISAKELAGPVDSVTFCLSKGLCAPVGSVLCGTKDFIQKAHRLRKMLGGGMRQAGILASAGIIAIESMTARLAEDHVRTRELAEGLRSIQNLVLNPAVPTTNMAFLTLGPEAKLDSNEVFIRLKQSGILVDVTGPRSFRLVLHYGIDDEAVNKTVAAFHTAVQ